MSRNKPPVWSARAPLWLGTLTVLALLGGFGAWASFTNIAGAVIATGQIKVDHNRQAVQHPTGGVVAELLIDEGQFVEAGELLLRLDDADLQSALSVITAQRNEWRARMARLETERDGREEVAFPADLLASATHSPPLAELLDGQRNLFATRREALAQEVSQLSRRTDQIRNQINGISAQRLALQQQHSLIEEELTMVQDLVDRNLSPAARSLALRRERARLLGMLGELEASIAEAEIRINEIELVILQRSTAHRQEAIGALREMRVQEAELAERETALRRQLREMEIRAPISGIVFGLRVLGARSVISAAEPALFLIPQDRPFVISAQIAPTNIDEVYVGQPVLLRLSAFDARTTPELFGQVARVSADAHIDEPTGLSFYSAEIMLNPGEALRLGERRLIPGMPVEAFIRTQDRTPLAYLLRPMSDYFNRAMREN